MFLLQVDSSTFDSALAFLRNPDNVTDMSRMEAKLNELGVVSGVTLENVKEEDVEELKLLCGLVKLGVRKEFRRLVGI